MSLMVVMSMPAPTMRRPRFACHPPVLGVAAGLVNARPQTHGGVRHERGHDAVEFGFGAGIPRVAGGPRAVGLVRAAVEPDLESIGFLEEGIEQGSLTRKGSPTNELRRDIAGGK